jgi:hypothetical protein
MTEPVNDNEPEEKRAITRDLFYASRMLFSLCDYRPILRDQGFAGKNSSS